MSLVAPFIWTPEWERRQRNAFDWRKFLSLSMAHLKKGAAGHLLKSASGHLTKMCDGAPCYRQARYCRGGGRAPVWQTCAGFEAKTYKATASGGCVQNVCFYFDASSPRVEVAGSNPFTNITEIANCAVAACGAEPAFCYDCNGDIHCNEYPCEAVFGCKTLEESNGGYCEFFLGRGRRPSLSLSGVKLPSGCKCGMQISGSANGSACADDLFIEFPVNVNVKTYLAADCSGPVQSDSTLTGAFLAMGADSACAGPYIIRTGCGPNTDMGNVNVTGTAGLFGPLLLDGANCSDCAKCQRTGSVSNALSPGCEDDGIGYCYDIWGSGGLASFDRCGCAEAP